MSGPGFFKAGAGTRVDTPPPHDDLTKSLFAKFNDIDTDKDGFAGKKEIENAIASASFTGDDGAMVATLWSTFGDFEDFSDDEWGIENDGITPADATAYDRLREKDPKNKAVELVAATFALGRAKLTIAGAKTVFRGAPDPTSLKQGLIGDCWLIAALVGVAARNPGDIRAMVTSTSPTGPFEVTFPGAPKAVTVPMPTDSEIAIFSLANGIWSAIFELAFAAQAFGDKFASARSSAINEVAQGRAIDAAISLLTGHSVDVDELAFTKRSETRDKLKRSFANRKIVLGSVRGSVPGLFRLGDNRRENGMPMGHAYTVLGFDSVKDQVMLRNPWGSPERPVGIPVGDAFTLTLAEFEDNFTRVAYEE